MKCEVLFSFLREFFYAIYCALQGIEECCCLSTVHLDVMELEGDGERGPQPALAVSSPHHHGVAELVGVLVDDAIQLSLNHGRGADDHAIVRKSAFTPIDGLIRQATIIFCKLMNVVVIWNVARIDGAQNVLDNHVDGEPVVLIQFALLGQEVELIDAACHLADAPAQQHVETELVPLAVSHQPAYIPRLNQRHHGHG